MKKDVEKQLPEKVEHIVQCNLSRRQRLLYDEYINMDKTKETLADADFFSIMNVLMQLRKVCNHPDLFESRTIESPFIMSQSVQYRCPKLVQQGLLQYQAQRDPLGHLSLRNINLCLPAFEHLTKQHCEQALSLFPERTLQEAFCEASAGGLRQQRLAMEGQAVGKLHYTNCNLLAQPNTQNLQQTIP